MGKRDRGLTASDIGQWIDNDEGLYRWWKESHQSKRNFIRDNRSELTRSIESMLSGQRRPHYLMYG